MQLSGVGNLRSRAAKPKLTEPNSASFKKQLRMSAHDAGQYKQYIRTYVESVQRSQGGRLGQS